MPRRSDMSRSVSSFRCVVASIRGGITSRMRTSCWFTRMSLPTATEGMACLRHNRVVPSRSRPLRSFVAVGTARRYHQQRTHSFLRPPVIVVPAFEALRRLLEKLAGSRHEESHLESAHELHDHHPHHHQTETYVRQLLGGAPLVLLVLTLVGWRRRRRALRRFR